MVWFRTITLEYLETRRGEAGGLDPLMDNSYQNILEDQGFGNQAGKI